MILPFFPGRSAVESTARFRSFRSSLSRLLLGLAIPAAWAAAAPAAAFTEHALNPRSTPAGPTMFTALAPEATGVRTENRYDDPAMWGRLYHEFDIGAIGTGVAIGDYDGDGRPDIFVVGKTEGGRLFRNLGDWKFEDVSEKAGVAAHGDAARSWKNGATFADVNNDGRLDLYICRFNAPNLLYVNQGDGTFREQARPAGLDVSDACTQAAFCDYDRDGWLDVYIQTNLLNNAEHPSGQRDYLFHNNGDGTFTNVTDQVGLVPVPTQGNSCAWWDFDEDGWPDLYVANDFAEPDFLYHNNRDGTFTNVIDEVVPHMTYSSMGSDLGDVNNDGHIDLIVADMAATNHQKDQRTMADVRSRDVDPAPTDRSAPAYPRNALFINTGTGRCLEAAFLAGLEATDWTWSSRFEDLDNDGRLDLHITNGMHREIHNTDLLLRMMSAESATERIRIARASPVLREANLAFRNLGDLRFENVGAAWGLDQKGVSFGCAFGDLDGDGDLDLVYGNFQAGATVLRNDCPSGHRLVIELHGTVSNRFGIGARVDLATASGRQTRQLTLARGYMSSSEPIVHFGLGEDRVVQRLVVSWPSGHVQTLANLPADRRLVITEPAAPAPPARAQRPAAAGQFTDITAAAGLASRSREELVDEIAQQPLLPVRLNRRGPALAVGRLDASGTDAVAVGGTTLDPARIFRPDRPAHFTSTGPVSPAAAVDDGPLLLLDVDGDGADDLLITRGGASQPAGDPAYQPVLLLNDGHGQFRPAPADALPPLPISAGAAAAADFDRDGRLDVFIGGRVAAGQYPQAPDSALLVNRGGRFEDVTGTLAPARAHGGQVTGALWSDVDGDGWPDLLVTLEWGGVKCFHNQHGRGFDDWTERAGFAAAGTGWWTGLASADFNGDGRPDYVVGNVGLNTQYHADAAHPALLFWGDFQGSGVPTLVEACYEGDQLYPWRSRRDLGRAIPAVLKRFPRNDYYARATLGEILGDEALAAAERFAATELRSGVFLSQPDGTWRFAPLPRLAQIAPLQGIAAGDFDGDGRADLYAVQNSYAPNPVVGRHDGGLSQFLRGDGRGGFTAVPAEETHLVVPGDAKALAVADLDRDGWPDFVVTRNADDGFVFRNNGVAGRRSLGVALHGPAGNPDAIGARITAYQADGSSQTLEVFAGDGRCSQSSATRFFGSPAANPVVRFVIRWPSGATTETPAPPASADPTLVVPAP